MEAVMGKYTVHLVGESNYQDVIRRASPGDPVRLLLEPQNPYDPRAIRACDVTGATIGYLERESWLTRAILDDGTTVLASVLEIIGGEANKPSLGVVLEVLTAKDAEANGPRSVPNAAPVEVTVSEPVKVKVMQRPGCIAIGGGLFLLFALLGTLTDRDDKTANSDNQSLVVAPTSKTIEERVGPAPDGDPIQVARDAIKEAGHKCSRIKSASRRLADGSIIANCSNGQHFRVFTVEGIGAVAMSCEAAAQLGVSGAC
jgi:hypothetical protein